VPARTANVAPTIGSQGPTQTPQIYTRDMRRLPALRGPLALAALVVLAVVVAIPVLAASPSPSSGPGPGNGKGPKASHEPEVSVTLKGTVAATTAGDGSVEYTFTSGGRTLRLEAGPKWFWGDKNPLKPFVGKSVTIVGEQSGDELEAQTVDGTALRAPGKPPWAGGWQAVGKSHPGWSQDKADRFAARQAAKAAREKARAACQAAGTCTDHEPEESEAP
jgi:hypothetical protein